MNFKEDFFLNSKRVFHWFLFNFTDFVTCMPLHTFQPSKYDSTSGAKISMFEKKSWEMRLYIRTRPWTEYFIIFAIHRIFSFCSRFILNLLVAPLLPAMWICQFTLLNFQTLHYSSPHLILIPLIITTPPTTQSTKLIWHFLIANCNKAKFY